MVVTKPTMPTTAIAMNIRSIGCITAVPCFVSKVYTSNVTRGLF